MLPPHQSTLQVSYEATDFPKNSGFNGHGHLKLTWDEVLWATMTVGKTQRDLLRYGRYSSADFVHRIACMYAYFDISGGRMVRSPAFKTLDPSEKGIASFYLGMTMAKLYADKVLDIPWLMHISRYEAAWAVKYGGNTKRPDLFGCNAAGDWVVAEAKGRDRVTDALVTKMQLQKSAVATINGSPPAHRYGAATRFSKGQLALRVVDPPRRLNAQEVPIDPAAWLSDYYTPIVDLITDGDRHVEGRYLVGAIANTDIEIGISEEIVGWVTDFRERSFQRPAPRRAPPSRGDQSPLERRPLAEQSRPEDRAAVETMISGVHLTGEAVPSSFSDGLVVRSHR
jgi:hypothetical protein